uniref:Immunoglobulin V-set domain-containing protein n=1 Tax=Neolamprologus brichardi TaxID=32507 RepID=A0A3Q4I9F0_NEOBR
MARGARALITLLAALIRARALRVQSSYCICSVSYYYYSGEKCLFEGCNGEESVLNDILNDQNHRYTNRTSMKADALQTGDLSLTLRNPTVSDGGTYTCIVRKYGQDQSKTHVQLKVKGQCVKSVSTQYDAFKILSV